jgi:hypothetical protein
MLWLRTEIAKWMGLLAAIFAACCVLFLWAPSAWRWASHIHDPVLDQFSGYWIADGGDCIRPALLFGEPTNNPAGIPKVIIRVPAPSRDLGRPAEFDRSLLPARIFISSLIGQSGWRSFDMDFDVLDQRTIVFRGLYSRSGGGRGRSRGHPNAEETAMLLPSEISFLKPGVALSRCP